MIGKYAVSLCILLQSANAQPINTAPERFSIDNTTHLGIDGVRFTLNGTPAFLYGISYYGALTASEEFILRDLGDMKRYGFNWIRVWANWKLSGYDVSAIDNRGLVREPFSSKLKWLVAECNRQGIVVDVTLQRGYDDNASTHLSTLVAHRTAVETIVNLLEAFPNWYLDLANEHDVDGPGFVSFVELKELRQIARQIDSDLLVTASSGGDISQNDIEKYLNYVEVDFICPHRPRTPVSIKETEVRTKEYFVWMKKIGGAVPVHYQEPFRRGFFHWQHTDWQPEAIDFINDFIKAKENGAAGWCFHNGSRPETTELYGSFDMRKKRLFEQFDTEERLAISIIAKKIKNR